MDAGDQLSVPRVSERLADATTYPLDQPLRERKVERDKLQAGVYQFLDEVRQAATAGLAACARPFH